MSPTIVHYPSLPLQFKRELVIAGKLLHWFPTDGDVLQGNDCGEATSKVFSRFKDKEGVVWMNTYHSGCRSSRARYVKNVMKAWFAPDVEN